MEILDVNTKSVSFLTLTTYNGNKGTVIPAMCSLRKDEPFLDSDRAWIAAESWRLSCAPNDHGIVYAYIPWTYYITVDRNLPQQQQTDDLNNPPTYITLDSQQYPMEFVNIYQDKQILPNKQQLTIKTNLSAGPNAERTIDINQLSSRMMRFINGQMLTKNSIVNLTNPIIGTTPAAEYLYTLVDDPLDKLTGPAFGKQGLIKIAAKFTHHTDSAGNPSGIEAETIFTELQISKSQNPNLTKAQIAEYFSRGQWLFRDADANGSYSRPTWKIFGPMFMTTSEPGQTKQTTENRQTPVVRLYCKNGATFEVGQTVYQQYLDANNKVQELSSTITVLPDFIKDHGDFWYVYLSGIMTPIGSYMHAVHAVPYDGNTVDQVYYPYNVGAEEEKDVDHVSNPLDNGKRLLDALYSTCEVTVTDLSKTPVPNALNPLPNTATTTDPALAHKLHERIRITRRATEGAPVSTFSPNDFMQYFNVGFQSDQDQPYVLCTSPNGGWRLVVLADDLSSLRISKEMCDDMGLNNFMVVDGVERQNAQHHEVFPMVAELTMDNTDVNNVLWNWKEDFHSPASVQSHLEMRHYQEFRIVNPATGVGFAPLTNESYAPLYLKLIDTSDGDRYYKLISMINQQVIQTDVSTVQHYGLLKTDEDGVEYYEYIAPQKGAYIDNDKTVSIGSFSMYEAIRIVVPSGLSFDPMISSHADARILCELRLPFQNSAEVEQGFLKNEPLVMSTESAFYGDIIWNNPPSGLQYLPITTQGGIYDMEVACELIARDPNIAPVRVQLGYSDIFQIKMRFVNRN